MFDNVLEDKEEKRGSRDLFIQKYAKNATDGVCKQGEGCKGNRRKRTLLIIIRIRNEQ